MFFISTRGNTPPHFFSEAVEAGLAADGGLFLPETLPDLRSRLAEWEGLNYPDLAAEFFALFSDDIPKPEWRSLMRNAYASFADPDVAPLRRLDEKTYVLELFHGPTLAFKDFALQLLGLLYKRQAARTGKKLAVLGATSGDTGSAAIHGCLGREGLDIFILYPEGRIAPLQERQMACTGARNVAALRVPGTFDDAQRLVKECFGDREFAQQVNLLAVNSINIARVLAQCVYYLWAWLRLPESARTAVEFAVPTGNFGNVLAGWLAQQMGAFPQARFRVATNQNDILYRFFTTGQYQREAVQPSVAPSMDIQAASNFERFLYYALGQDSARLREVMASLSNSEEFEFPALPPSTFKASRLDDVGIERTIREVWQKYAYVVDPHTACGFTAQDPERTTVVLATAHPAKFPEVVERATGQHAVHPTLEALKNLPLESASMPLNLSALKAFICSRVQGD